MSKKKKREELEVAANAARQVLATDSVEEMQHVLVSLRMAWDDAGKWDGDTVQQVIGELVRRIEVLKRRPLEQALRACTLCHGHTFWFSGERDVDIGRVRLAVCDGCGATTTFWVVRIREGMGFQKVVAPEASGPFR